jgi:hypothetical protein
MYDNHYESFFFTGQYIDYRPVVLLDSGEYEIAVKRSEEFEELAAWRGEINVSPIYMLNPASVERTFAQRVKMARHKQRRKSIFQRFWDVADALRK